MSQIFSSIIRFLQQKYTKSFLIIGVLVFTGICFGQATSGPQYSESDMTKNIIEIFDLLFGLLALVLGPMVVLAGWLLSPDWTMGDFFGLRGYFKEVWILVANIVYIIFALMLLYMAIMQIFGGSESEYAFKKKLPSFLVGILLVPFTWLIVSWTLSFANQAVAAVLSIPMGKIGQMSTTDFGTQDTSMWHKKMLPTEFNFSTNGATGYGNMTCQDGYLADNTSVRCISPAEFLTKNQAGPFFIIMIYAYNIFKIQDADIEKITGGTFCSGEGAATGEYLSAKTCVENLMDIVMKFGLSLVVTVFFAIMLVALCWVLLMRAIKLWIYIMLSPLFGLAYFTGKGMSETVGEAGESGFGQVGFQAFFKLAMVPVLVSAVLAFGLLFIGVVRDNFHQVTPDPTQKVFCTEKTAGYMVTYCITVEGEPGKEVYQSELIIGNDTTTDPNKNANITLKFSDAFSNIIEEAAGSGTTGAAAGVISSVNDIFAHIILTMMALVFMFMGVKVAVQYDAVTKAAFSPFEKLGTSVGNFVAHSPSYLPLPHPAFAALTPAGMKGLATAINTKVSQEEAKVGRTMQEMLGDRSLMGLKASLDSNSGSVDDLNQKVRQLNERGEKILQTTTVASSIPHVVGEIQKFAEEGGVAMTESQKRGLQGITDTSTAQEFFSHNTELLKSMQDFYKSKDAADVSKFLQTIANTAAASRKQIDGEDLQVEKVNRELHFKVGDNTIKVGTTGGLVPGSTPLTSSQKTGFKKLAEDSGTPINNIDSLSESEIDTVLKQGLGISTEQLVGMNPAAKKLLLKTLIS